MALRSGIFSPGVFHKRAPAKRLCGKLWETPRTLYPLREKQNAPPGPDGPQRRRGAEKLYSSIDAVDGDFAGKDLLLAAVGADDELAVGVHVDGRAAAQLPARQVEGDVTAQIDAGGLILLPERRKALPCEGVEGAVEAEIGQRLGQPLGVGVEVYRCALQLQRGAVGQVGGVEIALGLCQIDADAADDVVYAPILK